MEEIIEHLNLCYSLYKRNELPERIFLVFGNLAGDIDSTVGAILLSHSLTIKYQHLNSGTEEEKEPSQIYIPCLGYPKEELSLKLEVIEHLKQSGIPTNEDGEFKLLSIFDFKLQELCNSDRLFFILHDHNQVDVSLQDFEKCVVGVIDHHEDTHRYDEQLEVKRIERVKSATR